MVVLNRIYTRTGDKGETALGSGKRVKKHDARIEAFGTVDETNAAIGVARLHTAGELDQMLARVQNDLFDLGADLCIPEDGSEIAAKASLAAARQGAFRTFHERMFAAGRPDGAKVSEVLRSMKLDLAKGSKKFHRDKLYTLRTELIKAIDLLDSNGADLTEILFKCTRKAIGEIDAV